MAFIEKKFVKKILRERPAKYRDFIKKKNYLLLDRQELSHNTAEASKKNKAFYYSLNLNHYPQISKFYLFLSNFLKVKKEQIILTEGCTGGIKKLIEVYCNANSNILVAYPNFILYSVFAKLYNVHLIKIKYNKELKLTVNSYLDKIDKNTSIVFITSPGAPNDFAFSKQEIEKICRVCNKKKILVALDDAYYPYHDMDIVPLVKKYNNFLVLRSFSKYHGLASLRVGYILANKKKINYLSKFRSGYEINTPTIEITKEILRNRLFFLKKKRELEKAKKFLIKEFSRNNIKVKSFGNANYLCVSILTEKNINKFVDYFYKKKIIIKYKLPSPFKDCILFTLSTMNDAKRIKKVFFEIYNKVV